MNNLFKCNATRVDEWHVALEIAHLHRLVVGVLISHVVVRQRSALSVALPVRLRPKGLFVPSVLAMSIVLLQRVLLVEHMLLRPRPRSRIVLVVFAIELLSQELPQVRLREPRLTQNDQPLGVQHCCGRRGILVARCAQRVPLVRKRNRKLIRLLLRCRRSSMPRSKTLLERVEAHIAAMRKIGHVHFSEVNNFLACSAPAPCSRHRNGCTLLTLSRVGSLPLSLHVAYRSHTRQHFFVLHPLLLVLLNLANCFVPGSVFTHLGSSINLTLDPHVAS